MAGFEPILEALFRVALGGRQRSLTLGEEARLNDRLSAVRRKVDPLLGILAMGGALSVVAVHQISVWIDGPPQNALLDQRTWCRNFSAPVMGFGVLAFWCALDIALRRKLLGLDRHLFDLQFAERTRCSPQRLAVASGVVGVGLIGLGAIGTLGSGCRVDDRGLLCDVGFRPPPLYRYDEVARIERFPHIVGAPPDGMSLVAMRVVFRNGDVLEYRPANPQATPSPIDAISQRSGVPVIDIPSPR